MILTTLLLVVDLIFLSGALIFTYEARREQEPRAPKFGLAGVIVHAFLALLIIFLPQTRPPLAVIFGLMLLLGAVFLIPGRKNARALAGASGFVEDGFIPWDERDTVFARNRSIRPGSPEYEVYYGRLHPEREEMDKERRAKGGPLGRPGSIDDYRPNTAMMQSSFLMPFFLGRQAEQAPAAESGQEKLDPARAAEVVKGLALHLGAAAVGVCRVDPSWAYSRRGEIYYDNWQDWGQKISGHLPYAVVIATEMDHDLVGTAPHTPSVMESAHNYAKGAYITTMLAGWFAALGYKGEADHSRHYNFLMVPLALDAGLGELGRFGYLISDRLGPRCRLFACLTDMPLLPDRPVDLGAEVFCEKCKKCAESCPSSSIPRGDKTSQRGLRRWTLSAETCFDYWGKVGTDCCVCMAVCPFSRPNRSLHRLVRWILKRSPLARQVFPHIDNIIYGRRWRPRRAPEWIDYTKGKGDAAEKA